MSYLESAPEAEACREASQPPSRRPHDPERARYLPIRTAGIDSLPVQARIPADGRFETVCCDCSLLHVWQIVPCADGGYVVSVWRAEGEGE